ncbi:TSUP family transporter [Clostridium sp. BJN0001]|uniref:sulfite exporter TauE/SafE family protein n=1 Tax=Clostridium sp. BJN0001 TaxID=2930219 RepID=UPI001FD51FB3|nr:TSUP family transporter [Clostridium sp. BJN0001]
MDSAISIFFLVCPLVFIGGVIDAAAGGGGLITLPAYVFSGMPLHIAYGTNKFANCIGSSIASLKFLKSGKIKIKSALISATGGLIGSWFGAKLVIILDEKYLKYCLMVILPVVALFLLFNRNFGKVSSDKKISSKKVNILSFIIGFFIGGYDGFFGPGTGTFLVIAYTALLNFNIVTASGNAKITNFASNFAALVVYIYHGKVLFYIGIPAAICSILGNYVGAHLAIKKGVKFIKPVILLVVFLLLFKIILEFI